MNYSPKPSSAFSSPIINSFTDIEWRGERSKPVVTMFSGGLDSSYLLMKLSEMGFTKVYAVAVDVGEPLDLQKARNTASHFGAEFVHLDGQDSFVRDAVTPAIKANAKYLNNYPISSSLSRPIIGQLVCDFARQVGAGMILHTANLSQNSLPRLTNAISLSGFGGAYGSPYVQAAISRSDKAAELAARGLTYLADRQLSGDENLWCREFESGPLDDPESFECPEDVFTWTAKQETPTSELLTLAFSNGELVAVNGSTIKLKDAISFLNQTVGKFGHGRFVGLEHISTGEKVLEVREAPAALILMDALRHIEHAALDMKTLELKHQLEQRWVMAAVSGEWSSRAHQTCQAAIENCLNGISGEVTYHIDSLRFTPKSIKASPAKYIRDRDQWEAEAASIYTPLSPDLSTQFMETRHA